MTRQELVTGNGTWVNSFRTMLFGRLRGLLALLFFMGVCGAQAEPTTQAVPIRPIDLPAGFQLVGVFEVVQKTKICHGQASPAVVADESYRVFTNGSSIRLYSSALEKAYHTYEIYRTDGIAEQTDDGSFKIEPGLQARYVTSTIVKQLSVTKEHLTLTYFPPVSDEVTVIFATSKKTHRDNN